MTRYVFFIIIIFSRFSALAQHNELYLIEAESALKHGDTSRAVAYYLSILDHDPQYFPAALRLSEIHYEKKAWSKAALYANIAIDILSVEEKKLIEPDYTEIYKDTVTSLKDYHQYQKLKIDIASVLHLRAKVRMKQENYHSAITDLDSAYVYAPFDADIQVDYGLSHLRMGNIPDALSRFFLALDIEPENYKAHYNIGLLYLSQQDTAEAMDYLQKSIQLNDTLTLAMLEIARIYMDWGQYDNAIDIYHRIIGVDGHSIEALFRRGYAYSKLDKPKEAIRDWDLVYQLDSSQIEAVRNAGLTRMAIEDYEGAIKDFSAYIDRLPGYTIGYLNRGYAFLLKNEYDDAVRDFEKMVEIEPNDSSGYYYIGLTYAVRGKKKKACRYFDDALNRGYDKENADEALKNLCM
jgi:tetratricopeptide (TPR) repeat protein